MKLGLAVVYSVREDSEALLRLHLDRIRRHTTLPYVIHGAPLRLPSQFRHHLDAPDITLHSLVPPRDVLSHIEHSALLRELLAAAIRDGCTHVGTLHVDSFPVTDGWDQDLARLLTPDAPVVAVMEEMEGDTLARPNLAGMMGLADFWRETNPDLTPSPELETTPAWRAFIERHQQHVIHSGVGLGYCLERAGKHWIPLRRTNSRTRHPVLAGIYGGKIFHLGAATRPKTFFVNPIPVSESRAMRLRRKLGGSLRRILPAWARRWLRPFRPLGGFYDERPVRQNEIIFSKIRDELFGDPDDFLARMLAEKPNPASPMSGPGSQDSISGVPAV